MGKEVIIYWVATVIFSLVILFGAYNYFTSPEMVVEFRRLGFPDYFRIELGIAKVLGVLALLLRIAPIGFKQFAYAGFTINLISAAIAHASKGDPVMAVVMPFVFLLLLVVSYIYYPKLKQSSNTITN